MYRKNIIPVFAMGDAYGVFKYTTNEHNTLTENEIQTEMATTFQYKLFIRIRYFLLLISHNPY